MYLNDNVMLIRKIYSIRFILVVCFIIPLLYYTCEPLDIKREIAVSTGNIIATRILVIAEGNIIDLGTGITQHGHYWPTSHQPTTTDSKTTCRPANKKFMIKNFKNLLAAIHRKKMKEQEEILEKTINEWMGDSNQVDDIVVMELRI